ncbi:MAG: protein-glutamate O-methyltransferase CheR [Proteobacteria bacterium]|nr:protein-glutamate O-methyltransferase CheR [Pseudomonadota bacterium]MBU4009627.1 protein-glutamate O-methyltransferase CheR [Pseudomonadota bacterium]MBU4037366.1 protein-glutamate O-methyltransferase CheR [Pseudomonadota bacterium]
MDLTTRQFKRLSEIVYHECGINLHDGKKQLLQSRLDKRLRSTGIKSVKEYLKVLENDQRELINFLDAVSTNHTYFFRESHHFKYLTKDHMNIWCAASSSGEEPYSLAIYCLEKGFKPSIIASDISTRMLRMGQNGIYSIEKAKNLPPDILRKYFQKGTNSWNNHVRVKNEIRQMVTFKRYNLISDPIPSQKYDIIFCRNVFIYFDNETKSNVAHKLHNALKAPGCLIIGGAESLNTISHPFKYVQPSIYNKVLPV